MVQPSIIRKIKKLNKKIENDIVDLNSGGCCVYAAYLSKRLKELGYRANGIVINPYGNKHSLAQMRNLIENPHSKKCWNEAGINFHHVAVELSVDGARYHIDSEGIEEASVEFRGDTILSGRLKVDEMIHLSSEEKGWNSTFDREQIPHLKKLIEVTL